MTPPFGTGDKVRVKVSDSLMPHGAVGVVRSYGAGLNYPLGVDFPDLDGTLPMHESEVELVLDEPVAEDGLVLADWERELLAGTGHLLDPSDPFEAVLAEIVETNRRKRRDYTASGSSPWSNFELVEAQVGGTPGLATEVHIATKQARLLALATREGLPQNESVEDTLLDRAVYAIIALARYRYPDGGVK